MKMTSSEEYHPQHTPMGSPQRKLPLDINRALLPVKGFYFVFMAAVGDLLPFIAVYMKHLGLNPTETGIIYGVMPFVGFFCRPLIGAVADKYHRHKLVLMVVTALTGVFYLLLVTVPERPSPQHTLVKTKLMCNTQDSFIRDCQNDFVNDPCSMGITAFSNRSNSDIQSVNKTVACKMECKLTKNYPLPLEVCFTNDTSLQSYQPCQGLVHNGTTLIFSVPDFNSTINAPALPHSMPDCKDFDLKDVNYKQTQAWQILCNREQELDCTVACPVDMTEPFCGHIPGAFDKSFFLFFILFLLANIAFSPIFPILDAAAYNCLGEARHLWGKQRIWGTFGFALFAITSTFIMYIKSTNKEDVNYSISFYIFGPLCLFAAFIAQFITISSDIRCGQFVKNVCKLLSYKEVSAFLLVIMYFGIVLGGLEAFLFWFLISLDSSPLVFGFMLVVNCLAEMPMLWIAGSIIKRIGLVSCLYLALLCCGVRLLAYSLIVDPWFVLLVEPVHGVTFGLMYAAASSYASIISPPGMSATVQGLLGGVHFGFGKGIGSLITGFLYEGIGPRWTWRFFAIISMFLLALYILLNVFIFKQHTPSTGQNRTADQRGDEASPEDQLMDNGMTNPIHLKESET